MAALSGPQISKGDNPIVLWFILIVASLTIVGMVIIWRGLNRSAVTQRTDVTQENLEIARQRMAEATQDGNVEDRNELENALLEDLKGPDYTLTSSSTTGTAASLFIILIVPIFAALFYMALGDIRWRNPDTVTQQSPDGSHPGGDLNTMLSRLEQSLAESPDNPDRWVLAGKTYMMTGRYVQAESAYARVNQLIKDNPRHLTAWADASLMANGGVYTDEILARVHRALEINPRQANALWLAGIGARNRNDSQTALDYFTRVRPLLAQDPDARARIDALITEVGGDPAAMVTRTTAASGASAPDAAASAGSAITVRVDIDQALLSGTKPDDTVFVFARAPQGPRCPLAVSRIKVADLPAEVVLDDSLAMIADQNISSVDRVLVTARISKNGNPVAEPGDLTSVAEETVTNGFPQLSLVINRLVE